MLVERRPSSAKSKESQVEEETGMEFCEATDAKHSANGNSAKLDSWILLDWRMFLLNQIWLPKQMNWQAVTSILSKRQEKVS